MIASIMDSLCVQIGFGSLWVVQNNIFAKKKSKYFFEYFWDFLAEQL